MFWDFFFGSIRGKRNKSNKLAIINQREFPLCLQYLSGTVTFLTGRCFMIHVIYYSRDLPCSAIACCRKGHNMCLEGRSVPEDFLMVLLSYSTTAKSRVFTAMWKVWQSVSAAHNQHTSRQAGDAQTYPVLRQHCCPCHSAPALTLTRKLYLRQNKLWEGTWTFGNKQKSSPVLNFAFFCVSLNTSGQEQMSLSHCWDRKMVCGPPQHVPLPHLKFDLHPHRTDTEPAWGQTGTQSFSLERMLCQNAGG